MENKYISPRGDARASGGYWFEADAILRARDYGPCRLEVSFKGIRSLRLQDYYRYIDNLFILRTKGIISYETNVAAGVSFLLGEFRETLQKDRSIEYLVKRMAISSEETIPDKFIADLVSFLASCYLNCPEDSSPYITLGKILKRHFGVLSSKTPEEHLPIYAVYCDKTVDQINNIRRDFGLIGT